MIYRVIPVGVTDCYAQHYQLGIRDSKYAPQDVRIANGLYLSDGAQAVRGSKQHNVLSHQTAIKDGPDIQRMTLQVEGAVDVDVDGAGSLKQSQALQQPPLPPLFILPAYSLQFENLHPESTATSVVRLGKSRGTRDVRIGLLFCTVSEGLPYLLQLFAAHHSEFPGLRICPGGSAQS